MRKLIVIILLLNISCSKAFAHALAQADGMSSLTRSDLQPDRRSRTDTRLAFSKQKLDLKAEYDQKLNELKNSSDRTKRRELMLEYNTKLIKIRKDLKISSRFDRVYQRTPKIYYPSASVPKATKAIKFRSKSKTCGVCPLRARRSRCR